MSKLVKLGSVVEDSWALLEESDLPASAAELKEFSLIPVATYLAWADDLPANVSPWLSSDVDVECLRPVLAKLTLIALNFAAFADGRSFSQARILRDQLEYQGELRAVGAFIQDQLFFLRRCGVDSYSVADDADVESMQASLNDFTETYQAACDVQEPLFRRRV
ncbi:DUF934 domain-containing protein [Agaribacterium sp. ZY112]|uniref:DUF934 domain-containing protein n=1 Tax=Agaribacterium sp. ZY112 TaxID=3233574 RepID=UPI003523BC49